MKIIVAVSGGVDSVVLLDMLVRSQDHQLIVAHFDHGIRDDSADDARFVAGLAEQYGLPYEAEREELGSQASEELARSRRYRFLQRVAGDHGAVIATAHHHDDVLGSIAINISRGTGWRGLAVLDRSDVVRPLLPWSKARVYRYALEHRLEWVEDSTNQSRTYLRNRLRAGLLALDSKDQQRLVDLRLNQIQLKRDIDRQSARLAEIFGSSRHPYTMIAPLVAVEILRRQWQMTRPAAERLLLGIKTARTNTRQDIGGGLTARYGQKSFELSR